MNKNQKKWLIISIVIVIILALGLGLGLGLGLKKKGTRSDFNENFDDKNLETIRKKIISKLHIKYGSFDEEVPEQLCIIKHLPPTAKVLELGSNIGRATLIIDSLLYSPKTQFVTVESDSNICKRLKENKDINKANFNIVCSAISNSPMWQVPNSIHSNKKRIPNSVEIPTQTLTDIQNKYKINFDTIVADCEGCIVSIMKENPTFLDNIKLIIIEHDFDNKKDLEFFTKSLVNKGFKKVDSYKKTDTKGPGEKWGDGIIGDLDFVSIWKK